MHKSSLVVGLFEWVNIIITIYLLWKLIYDSPSICLNYTDTFTTILALIILFGARLINEILELLTPYHKI